MNWQHISFDFDITQLVIKLSYMEFQITCFKYDLYISDSIFPLSVFQSVRQFVTRSLVFIKSSYFCFDRPFYGYYHYYNCILLFSMSTLYLFHSDTLYFFYSLFHVLFIPFFVCLIVSVFIYMFVSFLYLFRCLFVSIFIYLISCIPSLSLSLSFSLSLSLSLFPSLPL